MLRGRSLHVLTVLLYLPVLVFYLAHFAPADPATHLPTGFVQYDQPYYMANARQYVDGATDGLCYALPFSTEQDAPAYLFQPHTWALGQLWRWTGADPGALFVLFGVIFGLLCIRVCLLVLREVLPREGGHHLILGVLFLWGGGVLVLLGFIYGIVQGETVALAWINAFRFDPAGGYWFMNLGRNLIYPFEAYYHFLFVATVLLLIRRRYGIALMSAALLVASHPFSGIGVLLTLLGWGLLERWYIRSREVPRWFVPSVIALLFALLYYHGVVLPRYPEHRALMLQWKLPWTETAINFMPAYLLVALLAYGRMRSPERFRAVAGSPVNRLLLIWVLTWFALENHEFAIEPIQPLHFTRGYTWTGLFLIGAPFLADLLRSWRERYRGVAPVIICTSVVALFLLDNAAWMTRRTVENHAAYSDGFHLTTDQRDLYTWLEHQVPDRPLLVANDPAVAYLALVYTPHRAYYSHLYNTPYAGQRYRSLNDYFTGRITDPLLAGDLLAVVYEHGHPFVFAANGQEVYRNASYAVYRMPPSR